MSRAHRTRTVVFDLDGTLVDSLPLVLRAFTHALTPFGVTPTMDMFAQLGGPPERIFPQLLGGDQDMPEVMRRLQEYNREHHHLIRPFDGVGAVLAKLRARDITLAVWTGRDRETSEWMLREHGLADFFSTVVCGDDFSSHKPNPEGLSEILARVGARAEETILVGDADVDVLGGAACGVDALLIAHARVVDAAVQAKTWRTVTSPFEAYDVVLSCVD